MTFLCIECGKRLDESNFFEKVKNRCKNCLKKTQMPSMWNVF